jgi:hypothetical protein
VGAHGAIGVEEAADDDVTPSETGDALEEADVNDGTEAPPDTVTSFTVTPT